MTNDEVREKIRLLHVTYNDFYDHIDLLREEITKRLEAMGTGMVLRKKSVVRFAEESRDVLGFYLYVDGAYFQDREAVSFNQGGFIGFAGWAGSTNLAPFLEGTLATAQRICDAKYTFLPEPVAV